MESESVDKLMLIEKAWREEGFAVESTEAGNFRKLRATRKVDDGPGIFDAAHRADTILRVPDTLVGYMRDAISQSERTGKPLNLARLVRRTMLPLSVLLAAKAVAEHGNQDLAKEPDAVHGSAAMAAYETAISSRRARQATFNEEIKGANSAKDEDESMTVKITVEGLRKIAPKAAEPIIQGIMQNQDLLPRYGIDNVKRVAHFLGQIACESAGFTRLEENMNDVELAIEANRLLQGLAIFSRVAREEQRETED